MQFQTCRIIVIKMNYSLLEKILLRFWSASCYYVCKVESRSFKPLLYWSFSSVHPLQNFPFGNSSDHENCNMKFPLNTFSDQITIYQISFEIFTSASNKLSIWLFPFFNEM